MSCISCEKGRPHKCLNYQINSIKHKKNALWKKNIKDKRQLLIEINRKTLHVKKKSQSITNDEFYIGNLNTLCVTSEAVPDNSFQDKLIEKNKDQLRIPDRNYIAIMDMLNIMYKALNYNRSNHLPQISPSSIQLLNKSLDIITSAILDGGFPSGQKFHYVIKRFKIRGTYDSPAMSYDDVIKHIVNTIVRTLPDYTHTYTIVDSLNGDNEADDNFQLYLLQLCAKMGSCAKIYSHDKFAKSKNRFTLPITYTTYDLPCVNDFKWMRDEHDIVEHDKRIIEEIDRSLSSPKSSRCELIRDDVLDNTLKNGGRVDIVFGREFGIVAV